jgi:hypothetical protein
MLWRKARLSIAPKKQNERNDAQKSSARVGDLERMAFPPEGGRRPPFKKPSPALPDWIFDPYRQLILMGQMIRAARGNFKAYP